MVQFMWGRERGYTGWSTEATGSTLHESMQQRVRAKQENDPQWSVNNCVGPWRCYADPSLKTPVALVAKVLCDHTDAVDPRGVAARRERSFEKESTALQVVHNAAAADGVDRTNVRPVVVPLVASGEFTTPATDNVAPTSGRYLILAEGGRTVFDAAIRSADSTDPNGNADLRERLALATMDAFLRLFDFAHGLGDRAFVHGDVKPDNVILAPGSDIEYLAAHQKSLPAVWIIDFGHTGHVLGAGGVVPSTEDHLLSSEDVDGFLATPMYRLRRVPPGERTPADDMFGLAVATYAVFSGGVLPYERRTDGNWTPIRATDLKVSDWLRQVGGVDRALLDGNLRMSWTRGESMVRGVPVPAPLRRLWSDVLPFTSTPHLIDETATQNSIDWRSSWSAYVTIQKLVVESPRGTPPQPSQPPTPGPPPPEPPSLGATMAGLFGPANPGGGHTGRAEPPGSRPPGALSKPSDVDLQKAAAVAFRQYLVRQTIASPQFEKAKPAANPDVPKPWTPPGWDLNFEQVTVTQRDAPPSAPAADRAEVPSQARSIRESGTTRPATSKGAAATPKRQRRSAGSGSAKGSNGIARRVLLCLGWPALLCTPPAVVVGVGSLVVLPGVDVTSGLISVGLWWPLVVGMFLGLIPCIWQGAAIAAADLDDNDDAYFWFAIFMVLGWMSGPWTMVAGTALVLRVSGVQAPIHWTVGPVVTVLAVSLALMCLVTVVAFTPRPDSREQSVQRMWRFNRMASGIAALLFASIAALTCYVLV